jgi:SAM-dependent methyltransferase
MNEPPDFDGLAGLYRWMELASFGPWLWWCRCAWLHQLTGCRHALVLGDGDGRFTRRLLEVCPTLTLDAVDASPAMLRALVRRTGMEASRVRTHCADARSWQPDNPPSEQPGKSPYDLVVTHFFLDCLTTEEVRSLANRVRSAVAPQALWVVSEFAIPDTGLARLVARPVVAGLYLAFGWLTGLAVRRLPEYAIGLRSAGFVLTRRRAWLGGLLVSEIWSASPEDIPVTPM